MKLIALLVCNALTLVACNSDAEEDPVESTDTTVGAAESTESEDDSTVDSSDASIRLRSDGFESPVEQSTTDLGVILVDTDGMTLYGFVPDEEAGGEVTCIDDCVEAWPPLIVEYDEFPDSPEYTFAEVIDGPNGNQVAVNGVPLYTYSQDEAAGDVNGQGVGDQWYVVTPFGDFIKG